MAPNRALGAFFLDIVWMAGVYEKKTPIGVF
jgi:hypothetical protein